MDITNRDRRLTNARRKGKSVQGGGAKRIHLLTTIIANRAAKEAK
jgi:hypothetical protein